ncbi:MAG: DUF2066 domain-containing protein [Wenzhouxiangellaceae bacterium]|nr:DUF2066 domain-containing protein [Wenzhouxiangellaceae bacterium]MBS3746676.1 DUF2066 domain-containing protein [Wenzhouxiangellaceae bacterium]MBS3822692.1 DUF2066 domain-containing protein [Wenzhouxiangellaceae bacterium]
MNIPRIIMLVLALAGGSGWAAAQDRLYVGEAVIEEASAMRDRPPLLDALNQVLVRLTGQVGADLVATLEIDAERAGDLALGRQFRRVEVPGDDRGDREQRRLRVDFDPAAVNRLIEEAGLQRWGSERPEMLLWIVTEGRRGAEFLEQDRRLQHTIDELAFRYGIELTRPILDASDRVDVTPADVRGGFTGVAVDAMRRYGADGVIMLDLRPNRDFWTGRWAWRIADSESTFQRSGAARGEVLELGLGRIAESLAARFSVRPTANTAQRVVVSGIETPAHYNEVQRFLENLTGVESVRVLGAVGSAMTFSVRSSTDGLRQRIELTGPLEFQHHDLAAGALHYRFAL